MIEDSDDDHNIDRKKGEQTQRKCESLRTFILYSQGPIFKISKCSIISDQSLTTLT